MNDLKLWESGESSACCCTCEGDIFACRVAKVVFAVWGEKRWSHREFVVLVVSGRSVNVSRKCCPEVKSLGVGAEFCIAVNFGGDVKLFLCVAYWIYLIHIQLGTIGLREVHKFDSFPPCVDATAAIEEQTARRLHWTKLFSQRRCLTVSPICAAQKGDWIG